MALDRYPLDAREDLLVFPILAALAKRPMNITETARALHLGIRETRDRLRALERIGYVVHRADNRWVVVVRLKIEGALKPVGVPGIDAHLGVEATEGPEAVGTLQDDLAALPLPHITREAVAAPVEVLTPVQKVARKLKVPEEIEGLGAVAVAAISKCLHCGKPTPLKYGVSALCAGCAREIEAKKKA